MLLSHFKSLLCTTVVLSISLLLFKLANRTPPFTSNLLRPVPPLVTPRTPCVIVDASILLNLEPFPSKKSAFKILSSNIRFSDCLILLLSPYINWFGIIFGTPVPPCKTFKTPALILEAFILYILLPVPISSRAFIIPATSRADLGIVVPIPRFPRNNVVPYISKTLFAEALALSLKLICKKLLVFITFPRIFEDISMPLFKMSPLISNFLLGFPLLIPTLPISFIVK